MIGGMDIAPGSRVAATGPLAGQVRSPWADVLSPHRECLRSRRFRVFLWHFQGLSQLVPAAEGAILPKGLDASDRRHSTRGWHSASGFIAMRCYLGLPTLCALIAVTPVLAQDSNRPFTPSGEVRIPSGSEIDRMLDSKTVPPPDKEFSADDAKAIQQMDQRAKRIDQEVKQGICTDC